MCGGGGLGGGPAQLGAGRGDLGSLLGTLSTGALLLGLRVLVERKAAQLSLSLLLAVLGGVEGLFVFLVSCFCIMILPYFLTSYF